jgi:hypothetical protein
MIIASISEIAKRSSVIAAVVTAMPLTSILAFCWIYYEGKDVQKISELSTEIAWLIIPSIVFFIALPLFLKYGFRFAPAMIYSYGIMFAFYGVFMYLKKLV